MTNQEAEVAEIPKKVPQDLVTENGVKKALEAKFGPDASLKTWEVKDFTNKGDNYACFVSSVLVTYEKDGLSHSTSFVVKLNPCRAISGFEDWNNTIFSKEGNFYFKIVPELNNILESIGQPPLKLPQFYHMNLEKEEEIIYLEDLRDEGFKMGDRTVGLDVQHLAVVLEELSRLHAVSVLFKDSDTKTKLIEKYPFLEEMFASDTMLEKDEMKVWIKMFMETSKVTCFILFSVVPSSSKNFTDDDC